MKKFLLFLSILFTMYLVGYIVDLTSNRFEKDEAYELFKEKLVDNGKELDEMTSWIQSVSGFGIREFYLNTFRSDQTIFIRYYDQEKRIIPSDSSLANQYYNFFHRIDLTYVKVDKDGKITLQFRHRDHDLNWLKLIQNSSLIDTNEYKNVWLEKIDSKWSLTNK